MQSVCRHLFKKQTKKTVNLFFLFLEQIKENIGKQSKFVRSLSTMGGILADSRLTYSPLPNSCGEPCYMCFDNLMIFAEFGVSYTG